MPPLINSVRCVMRTTLLVWLRKKLLNQVAVSICHTRQSSLLSVPFVIYYASRIALVVCALGIYISALNFSLLNAAGNHWASADRSGQTDPTTHCYQYWRHLKQALVSLYVTVQRSLIFTLFLINFVFGAKSTFSSVISVSSFSNAHPHHF